MSKFDKIQEHYIETRRHEVSVGTIAKDLKAAKKDVQEYIDYLNSQDTKADKKEIEATKKGRSVTTHMIKSSQKGRKGVCIMTETASMIGDATRRGSSKGKVPIHKCNGAADD